jgi:hypothetical protein
MGEEVIKATGLEETVISNSSPTKNEIKRFFGNAISYAQKAEQITVKGISQLSNDLAHGINDMLLGETSALDKAAL